MALHFCTLTEIFPVMLNMLLKSLDKETQGGCACNNTETLCNYVCIVKMRV